MRGALEQYREELQRELDEILAYWSRYAVDNENGGFAGRIDHENNIYSDAPKGSVLNSRILWSYSAAYRLTQNKDYLELAARAYDYIQQYFIDEKFGGVYWTVDHKGRPLDTKKQMYALAFAVYGMSEYYLACGQQDALDTAIRLYHDIVAHSYDKKRGGYIEATARDWGEIPDLRLSEKDSNEKKSMNTHLHVLEAFANLYRAWPNEVLKQELSELVRLFLDYIISKKNHHLVLFFDDQWNERSNLISYGHDIEASWLLQETAALIRNGLYLMTVKKVSLEIAKAAVEGLDSDGGLWYEYDAESRHLIKEKHSWPQAEAMIGFFNAWQNTGEEKYLRLSLNSWQFVKNYMHDKKCGEWYWGVYDDYSPMLQHDKVGVWKCPYHNSRACIEIINRINSEL